jgi:hypothetical protein
MTYKSRRIWVKNFGEIPVDENGFTYEVHHIDGNNKNDNLYNLQLLKIKDHLEIHLLQGDWGAASLIGKRLGLGPNYSSNIQKGKKRPGIGGAKKGTISPNKGKSIWSDEMELHFSKIRKGKIHSIKYSQEDINEIRLLYSNKPKLENQDFIGKNGKNGILITYEREFAKQFSKSYKMTTNYLFQLITNKEIRKCLN